MNNPVLAGVAESIRRLSPYQPGRPIADVARERGVADIVKLASNENPLGAGEKARHAIANLSPADISRYPDANGLVLRAALAARLSTPMERILPGNGSNDILELAAQLTLADGATAVYSRHAFVVYALATAARRARASVVAAPDFAHDLTAMAAAASAPSVRLMFVANPNNPTGSWRPPAEIRRLLEKTPPRVLVVLDEAYCEYLPDGADAETLALLADFPNLLIARTFSKIHGLAGLRAGYGVGDPALIEMLNRIRQPFNMSAVAQLAATAALSDAAHVAASRAVNSAGMKTLTAALRRRDIPFLPSRGNFLAFRPPNAAALHDSLLSGGVIVRKLPEYEMPDWLRVSIGTAAENEKFLKLLGGDR